MRKRNLAMLQIEDLYQLYEEIAGALADRITAEKHGLEHRLAKSMPFDVISHAGTGAPVSLSLTDRGVRPRCAKVVRKDRRRAAPSQRLVEPSKKAGMVTCTPGRRSKSRRVEDRERSKPQSSAIAPLASADLTNRVSPCGTVTRSLSRLLRPALAWA